MSRSNETTKVSLCSSLAYHFLAYKKEEGLTIVKDFLEYLTKSSTKILPKQTAEQAMKMILSKQKMQQRQRKELIQACNLQLTIEQCDEVFPYLMKSKQINRDEIEGILSIFNGKKI